MASRALAVTDSEEEGRPLEDRLQPGGRTPSRRLPLRLAAAALLAAGVLAALHLRRLHVGAARGGASMAIELEGENAGQHRHGGNHSGRGEDEDDGEHKGAERKDAKPQHAEHRQRKPEHKKPEHKKPEVLPDMGMGFPRKEGPFKPSLFCWSVMNINNWGEVATIKGQLRNRTGIFGCDNVAVLSGKRVFLGHGHKFPNGSRVKVYSWLNPAHSVPMGNLQGGDHTNSFKNADIFINAWDILTKSKAIFGHDWTAKVDPDAVFFAHRLRWHVAPMTTGNQYNTPMWLKNCNFRGPKLYGALEIFNEAAMRAYEARGAGCKNLPWGGWGEDEWIDTCMQQIGAQPRIDYKLVGDHRCMSAECYDTERVAFHDYKSEALYYDCWRKSTESEKVKDGGYFCCTYGQNQADPCNGCAPSNRQWPGGSFCGGSKWSCQQCGATTKWCRMVAKNKAELA